jgi:predicted O-methyltransferase YrrM
MSKQAWSIVDGYFGEELLGDQSAFEKILKANRKAGLSEIDVSPLQGKFLALLVQISGARRILEVGTLGGYSTIWMAKALPEGGAVVTLESDPHHAKIARSNFLAADVSHKVELIEGMAADTLKSLASRGEPRFDFVFIDADKPNNPVYLDWAARLGHKGTVVVLDNVVREGAVADADSRDERVIGSRAGIEMLGSDPRFDATAIQTVGGKGYDGFAIAVLR